jgi:hypothetical protein
VSQICFTHPCVALLQLKRWVMPGEEDAAAAETIPGPPPAPKCAPGHACTCVFTPGWVPQKGFQPAVALVLDKSTPCSCWPSSMRVLFSSGSSACVHIFTLRVHAHCYTSPFIPLHTPPSPLHSRRCSYGENPMAKSARMQEKAKERRRLWARLWWPFLWPLCRCCYPLCCPPWHEHGLLQCRPASPLLWSRSAHSQRFLWSCTNTHFHVCATTR